MRGDLRGRSVCSERVQGLVAALTPVRPEPVEGLRKPRDDHMRHLARSGSAGAGVGETKPFDSAQGERMRPTDGVKRVGGGHEGFPR